MQVVKMIFFNPVSFLATVSVFSVARTLAIAVCPKPYGSRGHFGKACLIVLHVRVVDHIKKRNFLQVGKMTLFSPVSFLAPVSVFLVACTLAIAVCPKPCGPRGLFGKAYLIVLHVRVVDRTKKCHFLQVGEMNLFSPVSFLVAVSVFLGLARWL